MGRRIAQTIHNPFVTDYMVAAGNQTIVSLNAPGRLIGKTLQQIDFRDRHQIECLGLLRKSQLHRLEADPTIEDGDTLLLLGRRSPLQKFGESQCG